MVNPYHDERQDQWYGRQDGTTPCGDPESGPACGMHTTGLQNVTDTTIVFMNWFYSALNTVAVNDTVALERELGFDVLGCPEYDVTNIRDWLRALKQPGGLGIGLGVIDTDWGRTLAGLAPTASLAWNMANRTVMETADQQAPATVEI